MTDESRQEPLDEALESLRLQRRLEGCTSDEELAEVAADVASERDVRLREENKLVREELCELQRKMGWTGPETAKHLDVSRALLHRWLRGDYKPQESIILEHARALIARYRNAEIGCMELEVTEAIQEKLGGAARFDELVVMTRRDRGVGVTFAINRYLVTSFSKHASRAVILDPLSDRKESTFVAQLAQAVGAFVEPSVDETLLGLIRELQNERFTLIIDNAERLEVGFLKILSQIKVATRCALVLAGTSQLLENITFRPQLAELRADIDEVFKVPETLPEEEIRLVLEQFFERSVGEDILKAAVEASGKNLKRLVKVLQKVRRLGLSHKTVTPGLIRAASGRLIPLPEASAETGTLAKFADKTVAAAEKLA